jgi:hypothetical protein
LRDEDFRLLPALARRRLEIDKAGDPLRGTRGLFDEAGLRYLVFNVRIRCLTFWLDDV